MFLAGKAESRGIMVLGNQFKRKMAWAQMDRTRLRLMTSGDISYAELVRCHLVTIECRKLCVGSGEGQTNQN